ncbi:hypothetical protein ACFJIX_18800 [Roseateles sp. UC29_93]|uniref:hypothetical protein n=1 Tax=Roseateles sp. UC29_93 TaxID=3350177 RepID=UPI00366D36C0
MPEKKTRAPTGVLTRSPVSLRLYEDELKRLKAGAHKEQRTDAAFARLLVLFALKAFEAGKSIS